MLGLQNWGEYMTECSLNPRMLKVGGVLQRCISSLEASLSAVFCHAQALDVFSPCCLLACSTSSRTATCMTRSGTMCRLTTRYGRGCRRMWMDCLLPVVPSMASAITFWSPRPPLDAGGGALLRGAAADSAREHVRPGLYGGRVTANSSSS